MYKQVITVYPSSGIAMQGGAPMGQAPMQLSGDDALGAARAASASRAIPNVVSLVPNPFALGRQRPGPQGLPFR